MEILEINYINFRNLIDGSVKFFQNSIYSLGNGQGKTSLLEAVYFNATGEKALELLKANEMMKYGVKRTGVYIVYRDNIGEKTLTVKFNDNKKEYYYNNKKVPYDEFYGKLNVVTYIPEDIVLITGSPSIRRFF